jgi:hypothetical protein
LKESQDDAALHKSLAVLKEREIEQRLREKFSLILKAEQDFGTDSLAWEIDHVKAFLQTKMAELVDAFRESTTKRVQTIYDRSERADESTRALILEVLQVWLEFPGRSKGAISPSQYLESVLFPDIAVQPRNLHEVDRHNHHGV